ncbi:MAG: FAD:protein FMN transferase [Betaproteobacteria bacterium]|nr:FAD:protein FMN transferase [Betaproteobacteria bacterium]
MRHKPPTTLEPSPLRGEGREGVGRDLGRAAPAPPSPQPLPPQGGGARFLLLLAAIFLLTACTPPLYKQQAYVFGTLVEITTHGAPEASARPAVDAVLREFDRMHRTLHPWEPGPMETVNAAIARGEKRIPLPPGIAPLLRDAARLSALSDGLFNPAIGNLVRLWGFHTDAFAARLPDPAAVARLVRARPAMADLKIDDDALASANPAVRIDLGGYAKGYALDQAAAILKQHGIANALINIGGNVMALGSKGGTPWRVGIQHPRRAGALAMLELQDGEAIGTSGDYQRFFELDARRYSHLIDPRNGQPVATMQAVTVLTRGAAAGVRSDVASKPLFVAGPGGWREMAQRLGVTEALAVEADGKIRVTRALAARLTWPEPKTPVDIID